MDVSLRLEHWQSVCLIWTAALSISPGFVILYVPSAHFTSLYVSSVLVLSLCR